MSNSCSGSISEMAQQRVAWLVIALTLVALLLAGCAGTARGTRSSVFAEAETVDVTDYSLSRADALVVISGTKVTAEILRAGNQLKVVGRAGIGVDNIDVAAATELGILVVNAPTANLLSAAEHTFALLLAVAALVVALSGLVDSLDGAVAVDDVLDPRTREIIVAAGQEIDELSRLDSLWRALRERCLK